jgi:predicted metal-dependent enzyme (double-stranded beta helix superfamily)
MFDIDEFVAECMEAVKDPEPRLAVKEVLERAVQRPSEIEAALPATRGELVPIYASDTLSVLKVIWWPGMRIRPHNHLMWAAIGLYGGQEDNIFYRREGEGITVSGVRELRTSDVTLLGDDTIHAVANPRETLTGAIHVYGGDITSGRGRSEWDDGREIPFDFKRQQGFFASFEPQPTC